MASNMASALSANTSDTLEAIEKDFKETVERLKSNLEMLPKGAGGKTMGEASAKLQALGQGKERIFKIRQKELDADDYGQTILEETRKLNVGLGISVQQLVDGVRKETDAATAQSQQEISWSTLAMLALGVRDPDRIGAVRLALCRPQHSAPHARAAKFDEDPLQRRSRTRRSTVPARATRSRKCRNRCRCSARA